MNPLYRADPCTVLGFALSVMIIMSANHSESTIFILEELYSRNRVLIASLVIRVAASRC